MGEALVQDSFIPSGRVWDILLDPDVRQAFIDSHCVVPTHIVYPDEQRSLDGAKLYIYDNNFPGEPRFIQLKEEAGQLHFHYTDKLNSANSFTLGTATLRTQLTDDVDMPISGINLPLFIVDLLFSPARLRVEQGAGRFLGYKDGSLRVDPALGYICPWYEQCYLVRMDAGADERLVVGQADGAYTFSSIHPNGRSLTIKDALCTASTRDSITMAPGLASARIEVSEEKTVELHLADARPNGTIRYLKATPALRRNEVIGFELGAGMGGIDIVPPDRGIDLHVELKILDGGQITAERSIDVPVPAGNQVRLPSNMWENIGGFLASPEVIR